MTLKQHYYALLDGRPSTYVTLNFIVSCVSPWIIIIIIIIPELRCMKVWIISLNYKSYNQNDYFYVINKLINFMFDKI